MTAQPAAIAYAARLSPLSGETTWTLQDGALIERRGKASRSYPLTSLTRMTLLPAQARRPHPSAALRFGLKRLVIPAAGFGLRGIETQLTAFSGFVRILAAQAGAAAPAARFVLAGGVDRSSPLIWAIILLGAGATGMLLASMNSVTSSIGLSLASHMIFAGLLLAAVLPWLKLTDHSFDPLRISETVLPR